MSCFSSPHGSLPCPAPSLDGSWVEVIGYGARQGWQWGRDVVFTYGPLGFLLPNSYGGEAIGFAVAANMLLALAFAQGLLAILPRDTLWSIGLFMLIVLPAAMMGRPAYTFFGPLAALLYFERPDDLWHWRALIVAAAAGVFAMVYFSSGVLSLGIFLLVDVSRAHASAPAGLCAGVPHGIGGCVSRRRAGDSSSASVPARIHRARLGICGRDVVRGESIGARGVSASQRSRVRERSVGRAGPSSREGQPADCPAARGGAGPRVVRGVQDGFVRHDFHSVAAWETLAMLAVAYAAMRWHDPSAAHVRWASIGLSVAACAIAVFASEQRVQMASLGRYANVVLIRRPVRALEQGRDAVFQSAQWRHGLRVQRTQSLAAIRAAVPLPIVNGSVDVIASVQSAVLAHGLLYRPRPIFQDYAAYTPWLVERNRAHYHSPRAAEYVFFRPNPIGNRYPLLEQGTTVNELLSLYDPFALERDLLVLKRRAVPLGIVMENPRESTARLGQWISLEGTNTLKMLSVTLSSNLPGRLGAFLFRPPILTLTVRLANGTEQPFRFIEGMAWSGFLLSPLIESSLDFAAAATNTWTTLEGKRVVAFRIDGLSESARRFFGEPFEYALSVLHVDPDAARASGVGVAVSVRRTEVARQMAALSSVKPPFTEAQETTLFTLAPSRFVLPVHSASLVRAGFGIRPVAWDPGNTTDGVCFRISEIDEGGLGRKVFERCLDPASRAADRPTQTAEVSVRLRVPGTLAFETDCRGNCNWDWSYWKDIDVTP